MSESGLYEKYTVLKNCSGARVRVTGFHFVLKPESDPVAFDALMRYAELTPNRQLATDLDRKLGEIAEQNAAIKKLESSEVRSGHSRKSSLEVLEMLVTNFGPRTIIDAVYGLKNRQ